MDVKSHARICTAHLQDYTVGDKEAESSPDFNKRSSLPVAPVSVGTTEADLPRRPSSLEVPPSHTQRSLTPERRREKSSSRSPSPAPGGERKTSGKVPKLEFPAQSLLAAIESKQKSPRLGENLQHIFDQLPSGMMQVCYKLAVRVHVLMLDNGQECLYTDVFCVTFSCSSIMVIVNIPLV